jgi:hypothetical protein
LVDGVAILRGGVLLDIGTLAEMRHLSTRSVEAMFEGAPPDFSAVAGVSAMAFSRREVAYPLVPPRVQISPPRTGGAVAGIFTPIDPSLAWAPYTVPNARAARRRAAQTASAISAIRITSIISGPRRPIQPPHRSCPSSQSISILLPRRSLSALAMYAKGRKFRLPGASTPVNVASTLAWREAGR